MKHVSTHRLERLEIRQRECLCLYVFAYMCCVWVNTKLPENSEFSDRFLILIVVPYFLFCIILIKGLFHAG